MDNNLFIYGLTEMHYVSEFKACSKVEQLKSK